jgi:drug/metabolite transporter (DMT)-like permease
MVLLAWQPSTGHSQTGGSWMLLPISVLVAWGIQGYLMKLSNKTMQAESIFFYMAATAVALTPVAILMTDFSHPINWGLRGLYLATLVHSLNAVGALSIVYAIRYGKALIVVPMTALAPVLTVVLSLAAYRVIPGWPLAVGIILASGSILLMAE